MYDALVWLSEWWYVLAGGWLLLAAVVGLIVGRIIRNRDRQEAKPLPWEGVQNVPSYEKAKEGPVSGT